MQTKKIVFYSRYTSRYLANLWSHCNTQNITPESKVVLFCLWNSLKLKLKTTQNINESHKSRVAFEEHKSFQQRVGHACPVGVWGLIKSPLWENSLCWEWDIHYTVAISVEWPPQPFCVFEHINICKDLTRTQGARPGPRTTNLSLRTTKDQGQGQHHW